MRSVARWKPFAIGVALAAIGVLAACGGGAGPGVASLGASTTTTIPETSQTASPTDYAKDVAYAQCMRSHGVPSFPDPNAQGDFLFRGRPGARAASFEKANRACQHLEPNGGHQTAAENAEALKLALEASACMRSHGVPNFPDPRSGPNGGLMLRVGGPGLNPNSSAFKNAMRACQSLFNAMGAIP